MKNIFFIEKGNRIEKEYLNVLGGKALQQAIAAQENLPVLNGLVITTEVFPKKDWFEEQEKTTEKERINAIKNLLNEKNIDLFKAVQKLNAKKFAVRSSATAEDLEIASFAGSFSTILNVKIEGIFNAIYLVWRSTFSERVHQYLKDKKLDHLSKIKMAVLIQPMLDPILSGVGLSHPLGKPESPFISVGVIRGLGEPLVRGDVFPQAFLIERNSWRIVELNDVIDIDIIYEIASDVGRTIEYLEISRGTPQDIEFSIDKKMEFILLQNRPIAKKLDNIENVASIRVDGEQIKNEF